MELVAGAVSAAVGKREKKEEGGVEDDSKGVSRCLEEERRGSRLRKSVNLDAGRRQKDKFSPRQVKQVI